MDKFTIEYLFDIKSGIGTKDDFKSFKDKDVRDGHKQEAIERFGTEWSEETEVHNWGWVYNVTGTKDQLRELLTTLHPGSRLYYMVEVDAWLDSLVPSYS